MNISGTVIIQYLIMRTVISFIILQQEICHLNNNFFQSISLNDKHKVRHHLSWYLCIQYLQSGSCLPCRIHSTDYTRCSLLVLLAVKKMSVKKLCTTILNLNINNLPSCFLIHFVKELHFQQSNFFLVICHYFYLVAMRSFWIRKQASPDRSRWPALHQALRRFPQKGLFDISFYPRWKQGLLGWLTSMHQSQNLRWCSP